MKYRKRPVVIEAVRFNGSNFDEIFNFAGSEAERTKLSSGDSALVIRTLEGKMASSPGDYIIKGVQGEFYSCKPDIFELTYEKAE